jgi:hypothetical protein
MSDQPCLRLAGATDYAQMLPVVITIDGDLVACTGNYTEMLARGTTEGHALADLLYACLPAVTLHALEWRLAARTAADDLRRKKPARKEPDETGPPA